MLICDIMSGNQKLENSDMTCSSCGYMMGAFDKECLRCKQNPPQSVTPLPQTIQSIAAPDPMPPPVLPAAMMLCPACNNSMSRKARACPHCGESFEPPTEKRVLHLFLIVWAILNTLGVLTGTLKAFLLPDASANSSYVTVIVIVCAMWCYAAIWWAIARWYGRKIQAKR